MNNLWPVKLAAVAASVMLKPGTTRTVTPQHILIFVLFFLFAVTIPTVFFSVKNREQTTFFLSHLLCICSTMIVLIDASPLTYKQQNAVLLFTTSHLNLWISHSLTNKPRLMIYGPFLKWIFMALAIVLPFTIAAILDCQHESIMSFAFVIFSGEIVLMITYVITSCIKMVSSIYENIWM